MSNESNTAAEVIERLTRQAKGVDLNVIKCANGDIVHLLSIPDGNGGLKVSNMNQYQDNPNRIKAEQKVISIDGFKYRDFTVSKRI